MSRAVLLVALLACRSASSPRPRLPLVTTAERTHWLRTGHYDEAVGLCRDFARAYDGVTCDELGRTSEDRPIVAVRVERRPDAPYIYIQAGIHAGEIEGKDAGFWFLRDFLDGKVPGRDALDVVFIPVMNPDGHERFTPNNRPNQRGPAEMGWRTNAARLNLNRDYVKADAPETQAVLRVIAAYDPVLLIDLHTTDGAKFEHDISINAAPVAPRSDHLEQVAHALSDSVVRRLSELGHLPVDFYPSFIKDSDPLSGFARGEAPPRFSQCYAAARNRLGVLVETHSWRTYKERAQSTYHALQAMFEEAVRSHAAWRQAFEAARAGDDALRGGELPRVFEPGKGSHAFSFRGYAFDKRALEISGGEWIVYDEKTPQIWNVQIFDELVPKTTVKVPAAGYIVDGGFAPAVAAVLDRHHIAHHPIPGEPRVTVEVFRATKVTYQPPFEGHTRVAIEGAWKTETRTLDRGAIFVPLRPGPVRLIVDMLDPALPDSLAQWGEFNTVFERKEYMEGYVAEEVAREMIAKDPQLKAELDAAIVADPELAKNPDKRLEMFYRRHPSWDERLNLLPVYRTDRDFTSKLP
jgi:hypothetical protein